MLQSLSNSALGSPVIEVYIMHEPVGRPDYVRCRVQTVATPFYQIPPPLSKGNSS